ncbi:MAG: MFS transporter [Acidimicrobiales bacterium]
MVLVVMLAVMAFGSLMTIVTVSLDEIADDLGSTRATLTWMITGLMLAMAVCTPLAGKVGDLRGHRMVFLLGLAGGTVMTVASALAWDATSMILFRVLFGVAGAFVMPNGMALMMNAYGPERRATAVGWYQFAMTGAPTIGLVVGGPLIDLIGWRALFMGFAGISVLAMVVGWRLIRPTERQEQTPLDVTGAVTLGVAVLAGLLAVTRVSEAARDGDLVAALTDLGTLGMVAASGIALVVFVRVERTSAHPMLPLHYFRRRDFTMPMLASALIQFSYMGGFVVTPALLAGIYGLGVGAIALLLAARPGAFSIASPLGGRLAVEVGERIPIVAGAVAMVASMAAFAVASTLTGAVGIGVIVAGLVLTGVSAGISQPAVGSMVVSAVDPQDMGLANGMNQQLTHIGIVTGIQTMNVFVGDDASPDRFVATFAFGGVVAVGAVLAALASRPDPRRSDGSVTVEHHTANQA